VHDPKTPSETSNEADDAAEVERRATTDC